MSEAISEKVKKLLRLARCKGATPAEAANALNRALELIERHQLDLAALDLDEDTERLVCERIRIGQRMSLIKRGVSRILVRYFKVRTCVDKPDLAIMGFEQDVAIAGYVFSFLVRACSTALSDYCDVERKLRRKITTRKKQGFIQGWMYGLAQNLIDPETSRPEIKDSRTALILSNRKQRVENYFEELYPDPLKMKPLKVSLNRGALWRGYVEGKATTINQPLAGPSAQTLLLA